MVLFCLNDDYVNKVSNLFCPLCIEVCGVAVKVINIEVGHIEVCSKLEVSTNVGPDTTHST